MKKSVNAVWMFPAQNSLSSRPIDMFLIIFEGQNNILTLNWHKRSLNDLEVASEYQIRTRSPDIQYQNCIAKLQKRVESSANKKRFAFVCYKVDVKWIKWLTVKKTPPRSSRTTPAGPLAKNHVQASWLHDEDEIFELDEDDEQELPFVKD